MNWLRTILDTVIVCIAFNAVVAFIWILEPKGFSVMLPKGINTPKKEIPKKNMKPVRLVINLGWNFGDFFLLDWWLRAVYTDRVSLPQANRWGLVWGFGDFFAIL